MSSGFVSEVDLAERRRVKEELWQKTRTENDPVEPPPEEAEHLKDTRTLYTRLQEQKDQKQQDIDETHRLRTMVRGLEDDEATFLASIDSAKAIIERARKIEDQKAIQAFRERAKADEERRLSLSKSGVKRLRCQTIDEQNKKKQAKQSSLLAGAIRHLGVKANDKKRDLKKRKLLENESASVDIKPETSSTPNPSVSSTDASPRVCVSKDSTESKSTSVFREVAVYPAAIAAIGIMPKINCGNSSDEGDSDVYTSDSSSSSGVSDSYCDNVLRDLSGRLIEFKEVQKETPK